MNARVMIARRRKRIKGKTETGGGCGWTGLLKKDSNRRHLRARTNPLENHSFIGSSFFALSFAEKMISCIYIKVWKI